MTSDKKVRSNRRNAQKSTGPRTEKSKAAVRLNALGHGLLAEQVLLPGEEAEALQRLDERLRGELNPVGDLEHLLVDRIVAAYWRLRRLIRVETGIFAWERSEELATRAQREADRYGELASLTAIMDASLGISKADRKKRDEALAAATEIRRAQEDETATLGRTFARDADGANAFSKLSRYETAIERQLYRALHELERRQAARHGKDVAAPLAVDVDVSGLPEGGGS
jgi:hypothetical protein